MLPIPAKQLGYGAETIVEMHGAAPGESQDSERRIGPARRRKYRAANDVEIVAVVNTAVGIDHAPAWVGAHRLGFSRCLSPR